MRPVFKRIDTCAAEFASPTAYMYSTYEAPFAGVAPPTRREPSDRKKVVILGGGPNRIGQGIEFDYCCCHACFALNEAGYETIMINCNPETVSTDYDTSDRLYFEPLTAEDVLEIIDTERANGTLHGVIVQFGGQTPLKLAEALEKAGVPILGTSPDAIDLAEDRDRFKQLLDKLELKQPKNGIATQSGAGARHRRRARLSARDPPVLCAGRPRHGDRRTTTRSSTTIVGCRLVPATLDRRRPELNRCSDKRPLLIDRYLSDAIEVDVDCLARRQGHLHRRHHGAHRGGRHPFRRLAPARCRRTRSTPRRSPSSSARRATLALALNVGGLMNVQYAIKDGDIYVLEVNPRASRTVPFVAKVIGMPSPRSRRASWRARRSPSASTSSRRKLDHVGVKEAVFPFARFPGVDTVLGPGDASTGEVMGLDRDFDVAFAKSQLGGGTTAAARRHRVRLGAGRRQAAHPGRRASCSPSSASRSSRPRGTQRYLAEHGRRRRARSTRCSEGRPHIVDAIKNGDVQLVFNTTEGARRWPTAGRCAAPPSCIKCPYYTTLAGAVAAAQGIKAYLGGDLEVRALQSYFGGAA